MMLQTQLGELINSDWIRCIIPMTGEIDGKTVYSLTAQYSKAALREQDDAEVELGVYATMADLEEAQTVLLSGFAEHRSLITMPESE